MAFRQAVISYANKQDILINELQQEGVSCITNNYETLVLQL